MRDLVLITGASSGIGAALAVEFAAAGHDLLLVARRREALELLADRIRQEYRVEALVDAVDLADPDQRQALIERLTADGARSPDILINNAGFGFNGAVLDQDPQQQQQMLRLNVEAVATLTRALVPAMLVRGRGGVLNVASSAAFQPGPWFGTYAASKSFVLSFTEALAEELRGSGVRVSCLCPGATASEFAQRARMNDSVAFRVLPVADVGSVARAGRRALEAGRVVAVPGVFNKTSAFFGRHFPRWIVRRISGGVLGHGKRGPR